MLIVCCACFSETEVMDQVTREASGLYTVSSSLLYKVSKEDVNSTFYCEVSYRMPGSQHMMESRAINVTVHCEASLVHYPEQYELPRQVY